MALQHRTLVVSEPSDGVAAHKAGAVHVYVRAGSSWSLQTTLRASDADVEDEFGIGLALHGHTLLVGAPFEDEANQGAVYRFERSPVGWAETAKYASTAASSAFFGFSVDYDGQEALVGAPDFVHFGGTCCPGTGHVLPLGTP